MRVLHIGFSEPFRQSILKTFLASLLMLTLGRAVYSQQATALPANPAPPTGGAKVGAAPDSRPDGRDKSSTGANAEFDEMRLQLKHAQSQIDELRSQLDAVRALLTHRTPSEAGSPEVIETKAVEARDTEGPAQRTGKPQAPANQSPTIDELIPSKSRGGQFPGAQGLVKTDRVKIGGYVDFRYVTRGIDEGFEIRSNVDEENPGLTDVTNFKRNGFISPRAVLGIAAAITPKLLFNSEIEFEFAGKETELEQMYLEYRVDRRFNLRGGIIVPPLGRFNLFHDANLQDIAPRPLVSTFVIPSTYKDAGIGALGEFRVGGQSRLTYEAYVVNGLRSDEGGEFAREGGIFESKGNNRFFDNNPQKSVVGRLMFSPALGLELGASGYRGKHDDQGLYNLSIWALDWKFAHRGFQVIGEFARASVQRASEDEAELAARQFLLSLPKGDYRNTFEFFDTTINEALFDRPSPSLGGFYVEARYRFRPQWLTSHFEADDSSIAPVFRYDEVNFDRSFPDFRFPLNMRRASFGVSLRPTEAASFNLTYHVDRKPDVFLRLPDGRPFPPYFTNLGVKGLSLGLSWAF